MLVIVVLEFNDDLFVERNPMSIHDDKSCSF